MGSIGNTTSNPTVSEAGIKEAEKGSNTVLDSYAYKLADMYDAIHDRQVTDRVKEFVLVVNKKGNYSIKGREINNNSKDTRFDVYDLFRTDKEKAIATFNKNFRAGGR